MPNPRLARPLGGVAGVLLLRLVHEEPASQGIQRPPGRRAFRLTRGLSSMTTTRPPTDPDPLRPPDLARARRLEDASGKSPRAQRTERCRQMSGYSVLSDSQLVVACSMRSTCRVRRSESNRPGRSVQWSFRYREASGPQPSSWSAALLVSARQPVVLRSRLRAAGRPIPALRRDERPTRQNQLLL